MKDWTRFLACPECKNALDPREFQCDRCGKAYRLDNGIYRFLDQGDEIPLTRSPDADAMVRGYREPRRWHKRIRSIVTSEYFPGKAWRNAKDAVIRGRGPCLVIGSGVCRYPDAVHLDLDDFPGVDVVADAHRLPFEDGSMNGVACEVVLEHVARPAEVIAETYRVLKPGGRFFFIVPFLFPYHGHPGDYRRWSREGLATEFNLFTGVEIGIHAGPCSAMVNLLTEWGYLLSGLTFPKGYVSIKGALTLLLFPIKFLDRIVNNFPEAHRMAATLYVSGAKAEE